MTTSTNDTDKILVIDAYGHHNENFTVHLRIPIYSYYTNLIIAMLYLKYGDRISSIEPLGEGVVAAGKCASFLVFTVAMGASVSFRC